MLMARESFDSPAHRQMVREHELKAKIYWDTERAIRRGAEKSEKLAAHWDAMPYDDYE